jgi:alkylglycerol monooxygenase
MQAVPYMVVLILIEGFINHFLRGRKQLMTLGGLMTRLAMISTYNYIHIHHHIMVIPWSSPLTWFLTAILLDLGYYCFHRASHEVGLLWAVHQVHHSSQEFNLTTAFR